MRLRREHSVERSAERHDPLSTPSMRIVFMGTPRFAIPSLEILLSSNYDVAAVVTAPDKPRGRGQEVSFSPVKDFSLSRNLPVLQPEDLREPSFINSLKDLRPDLFVVVAFRILPKELYTIPSKGSFNLHASLLPKYRGAAPINWAIINGERETGVTTFFLQDKVDTGSILLQARVAIGEDETAGELHDKLAAVGAEIVLQTVRLIELNRVEPRLQDERNVSTAPKIFKKDCRISWSRSAAQVHNFVRGLSPSPAAWTMHNLMQLKLFRTQIALDESKQSEGDIQPGIVARKTNERLLIQTGDGCVKVIEVQQEGRKRMGIAEFLRGYNIEEGERLT